MASLATALPGLEVNRRRGDELRAQLYQKTKLLLDHLDKLGLQEVDDRFGFRRPHP